MKKKKIKKANSFFFWLLRCVLKPVLYFKNGYRFEMKSSRGIKRPCLILSNHQTKFDQFAIGAGFRFGVNFVGSESLFRHGFGSWLMKVLARPIPISKGTADVTAVKDIISVIKDGGAVALFPSGNRSFFGEESYISPTIGKLAKKLKVPVVLVSIRGGYNTKPRWMPKTNKGKMRARVARIIKPEELAALSDAEVYDIINKELYFDEFEWNREKQMCFRGKRKAEHLESALFYCPQCKGLCALRSEGNEFFCKRCGARVKFNATGFFEKVNNAEAIPETVLDWSREQIEHIKAIDYSQYTDTPVFSDPEVRFSRVVRAKRNEPIGQGEFALYADRLSVCGTDIPITNIKEIALQGMLRMALYTTGETYCIDIPERGNLCKYMICGYHLLNTAKGETDEYYGY